MKVSIVTKYLLSIKGGIENHCYNLAKKLVDTGVDVEVHTSKDDLRGEFAIMNGIKIFKHKNFWRYVPKNCDVIHIHNFNIFPCLWIFLNIFSKKILRAKRPKLILTLHGGFTPWWEEFPFIKRILKKFYHITIGKFFLNFVVDRIIALNEIEREQLIKNGVKANKVIVVPNGVEDLAYDLPQQSISRFRKFQPYVLFLGRISKIKNIDFVIRCLKELKNVNFLVAGPIHETGYYQHLLSLRKGLGVMNNVIFIGEVSNIMKYELIDNSLAVVLPSHQEAEPIIVKETLVRGKPIIILRKATFSKWASNFGNVLLVSNEKELINTLNALLQKRIPQKHVMPNFAEEWRWNNVSKQILHIYKDALKMKI